MAGIRVGIVGAGRVANVCAKAMGGIAALELRAACNHTRMRLQEFCQNFSLSGYLDCAEMIDNERLQAVLICTPVPTHMYYARIACGYGCHVLCQAPVSLRSEDIAFLLDYRERSRRLVGEIDCHFRGSCLSCLATRLQRLRRSRSTPRSLDCRVGFNDYDTLYIMLQSLCGMAGFPQLRFADGALQLRGGDMALSCSFVRGRHNFVELKRPRCREDFEDHLLGFDDLYNLTHVDSGFFDQKKLHQSIADYHDELREWAARAARPARAGRRERRLELAADLTAMIAALPLQG